MEERGCRNCEKAFYVTEDDKGFYEKIGVPVPTFCPDCRKQRRQAYRNEFVFYNRTCDLCARSIISTYPTGVSFPVYCNRCWWSDKWDPKAYGQDIDWSRPFFEQFQELRLKVPALALVNDDGIGSINCEYTQNFVYSKNCYMTMVAWKWEDCLYSAYGTDAKAAVDSMSIFGSCDRCYECIFIQGCFNCRFVYQSTELMDCSFCFDCRNSTNCFMCSGLRNKKFYFKNRPYSEEEYRKIVSDYELDTYEGQERAKKEFEEFKKDFPHAHAFLKNCTGCEGDYLFNSKNSKNCFNATGLEDCVYVDTADTLKECRDLTVGGEAELCYEGITTDHSRMSRYCIYTWKSTDVYYCDFCQSSNNCFGSVALKKGEYCILNKQYSKEEYKILKAKLIAYMKETGEWGEFFPAEYSFFGYNETIGQIHFPLTKEEAVAKGFNWKDELQMTVGKETLQPEEIPNAIIDVSNSVVKETLRCISCSRNYRIVDNEFLFYKKVGIPIPRNCFFCRLTNRFKMKNPSELWGRTCMCKEEGHSHEGRCTNEFMTTYAPERSEKVYCEKCYQKEII